MHYLIFTTYLLLVIYLLMLMPLLESIYVPLWLQTAPIPQNTSKEDKLLEI